MLTLGGPLHLPTFVSDGLGVADQLAGRQTCDYEQFVLSYIERNDWLFPVSGNLFENSYRNAIFYDDVLMSNHIVDELEEGGTRISEDIGVPWYNSSWTSVRS